MPLWPGRLTKQTAPKSSQMPNVVTRILRLSNARKALLLEALVCTAAAWVMVRLSPYGFWRSRLGTPLAVNAAQVLGDPIQTTSDPLLTDISWAHARLAQVSRAHFTCLMLAFSARAMLRRRKLPSVLVLGVKLNEKASRAKMGAHAWVVARGIEVVGGDTRDGHTPIAAYRDKSWAGPAATLSSGL